MGTGLPLHPAIVHLPLGIVFLMPIVTVLIAILYRKQIIKKTGLIVIAAFHLLLSGASYVALETGEDEEHRVEKVLNEDFIKTHEEKAEAFMAASLVLLVGSVILLAIPVGAVLNYGFAALFVAQLFLIFLGYQVGHSGGELVYVHGAASAYTVKGSGQLINNSNKQSHEDEDEDDD